MVDWHYLAPPEEAVEKHLGPRPHPSGSPQSVHAGGAGAGKRFSQLSPKERKKLIAESKKRAIRKPSKKAQIFTIRRERNALSPTGYVYLVFDEEGIPLRMSGNTKAEAEAKLRRHENVKDIKYK